MRRDDIEGAAGQAILRLGVDRRGDGEGQQAGEEALQTAASTSVRAKSSPL